MKDFFISYTHNDELYARGLDAWLNRAGYSTVIQCVDFVPGTNFVLEMHEALRSCTRTLIVLSPDFLLSKFAASEWAATFAQDPDGAKRKLLGVKIRDCHVDGLLAAVTRIELVGLDVVAAEHQFISMIRAATNGEAIPRAAMPPLPKGPQASAKKSIRQRARGNGNVQIGELNGDFLHQPKVTQKNVVQPDERHITEADAEKIKAFIDQMAEIALLRGEPDTHGKWHKLLWRKFRVTSYKLIPRGKADDALAYLRVQAALERPKLRRAANGAWRQALYRGLFPRAKDLGMDDAALYAFASEYLGKPVASISKLGERDLKALHGAVYRRWKSRKKSA